MGSSAKELQGLQGDPLLDAVMDLTGLPKEEVHQDLKRSLGQAELNEPLTLEKLRQVMLLYLESVGREMTGSDEAVPENTGESH